VCNFGDIYNGIQIEEIFIKCMKISLAENNVESTIINVIRQIYSNNEVDEIKVDYLENVQSGGILYQINENDNLSGFIIITKQEDEDTSGKSLNVLVVEEFEITPNHYGNDKFAEDLGINIRQLATSLNAESVEIMINRQYDWLVKGFESAEYNCFDIRSNKFLPNPSNVEDVFELINDTTPQDRIIQVMFERENDLHVEFVETIDEIQELSLEGWEPIAVSVSFEPTTRNYQDIIKKSDEVIMWDEIALVFSY
jgi:hypothetical protein